MQSVSLGAAEWERGLEKQAGATSESVNCGFHSKCIRKPWGGFSLRGDT